MTGGFWRRRDLRLAPIQACMFALALIASPLALHTAWADETNPSATDMPDPESAYRAGLEAEWAGDYAAAREHYAIGVAQDHARSHYQLGFLLMDGLGGARDTDAARGHFRSAADGGVTLALVPYVYAYDDQDDPSLEPDPFIAARALLELANRDLASAGDTIMFWSPPMRRQVQIYLRDAGFYRGAIDGLIGQGSLRALRAFARARAPLPDLPNRRFARIALTAEGVAVDGRNPMSFSSIDSLAEARSAMLGVSVTATDDGAWRLAHEGEELLYWRTGDADALPQFELPGKPSSGPLALGAPFETLGADTVSSCALRVVGGGPHDGAYQRRCETRVAGVHLVFLAINGPFDDLDAENTGAYDPFGERLVMIDITPPLALRLADGEAN